MKKYLPLLPTLLMIICGIVSPGILSRAVFLSLACSNAAHYAVTKFKLDSVQKSMFQRISGFSLVFAVVFLVIEVYYVFFA